LATRTRYPFLTKSSSKAICPARSGNLSSKFWRKALLRAARAVFLADALLTGLERELVVVIAASTSGLDEWGEGFSAKLLYQRMRTGTDERVLVRRTLSWTSRGRRDQYVYTSGL
jgi:hypothetical protein